MSRTLKFVLVAVLVLAVGGIAGAHTFAAGYYSGTGTIQPMGISFYMQGTHYLQSASGATLCLLKSTAYDLGMYEGDKVNVSGWTQHTVEGHSQIMNVSSLSVLTSSRHTMAKTILEQGSFSSWSAPAGGANYVVRDAETWSRLYAIHKIDGSPAPDVNFSTHMVLAMFMGQQTSTAHYIEVNKVQRSGDRTFVTYTNHAPPAGSMIATVITNPYVFVKVTKAAGKVWFNNKKADALVLDATLTVSGHVVLGAGIDASTVKVGVFSMNALARYIQWPGNVPGDVTAGTGFAKTLVAPLPGTPNVKYYVIAFADTDGNNLTSGNPLIVSAGYWFDGGKWHKEGSSTTYASGATATTTLHLSTTSD